MIGPQGHHEAYLRELSGRIDRGPGSDRPPPAGISLRGLVQAVVLAGLMVFGCAGSAGALHSASRHCHDIGRQACLGLVLDDMLGEPLPAPRPD